METNNKIKLSKIEQQYFKPLEGKDVEYIRGRNNELFFRYYENNKLKRHGVLYNKYLYQQNTIEE